MLFAGSSFYCSPLIFANTLSENAVNASMHAFFGVLASDISERVLAKTNS